MKCIKDENGEVVRLTNETAYLFVIDDPHIKYVPKSVWKESGRDYFVSAHVAKHIVISIGKD